MNAKSQNEEILRHLQSGRSLSPLEALESYGSFRLGARVYDLKQRGHQIETVIVKKNGKRFATYKLRKSNGT